MQPQPVGSSGFGWSLARLQRQNEQAEREGRVARAMNLILFVTALQPFVDEFMGSTAAITRSSPKAQPRAPDLSASIECG
jgi:hypothetical protein